MTLRLSKKGFLKAAIFDFTIEVKKFAAAKKFWLEWQAMVEAERQYPYQGPDRKNFGNEAGFEKALSDYRQAVAHRHIPYPEPVAKPVLIALCVSESGEPDFDWIDDLQEQEPACS